MNIRISTDSTADIPEKLRSELGITVLPLTILYKDKEYRDGIDMTPQEFYKILDEESTLPVSSQVSLVLYENLFEDTYKEGYTDLIHVTINSKGSGTHQAAVLSRETFFEQHPEAEGKFNIHIIDSKTYSMAYGIPVIEAARMIRDGKTVSEIKAHILDWVANARPMFIPLNLKCVKKSGRISPAAAFVGDAIGLKPLITFEDGEAKILSKARGEHKAISLLIDTFVRERKKDTNYAIVYGSNTEAYETLRQECEKVADISPIADYNVGNIISINTGPNMIGIIYRR